MMINKTPVSFRHELKHLITPGEDRIISDRLGRLFPRDSHAGPGGVYQVNSLYFDTPEDKALLQKISGVDKREKFRLRYYGESPDFLRLEKKIKKGGLCSKRSARLSYKQAEKLLKGDIAFLLESKDPLMIELYSKMRGELLMPRTIVSYEREAFIFAPGNVRITLDRKVCTCTSSAVFLNTLSNFLEPEPGNTVLEVKYDAFLPDIVRMAVQVPDRKTGACSCVSQGFACAKQSGSYVELLCFALFSCCASQYFPACLFLWRKRRSRGVSRHSFVPERRIL